ncbi:hypothetical protein C8R43DRAFT_1125764 [Mycena crocata]|nr:hypothetical protein C8R43DRAFT_1125764 [Mycena crocata]
MSTSKSSQSTRTLPVIDSPGSLTPTTSPVSSPPRGYGQGDAANHADPASDKYAAFMSSLNFPSPSPTHIHRRELSSPVTSPRASKRLRQSSSPTPEASISLDLADSPVTSDEPLTVHQQRRLNHLQSFATLLQSPLYADGREPENFPLLRKFGGSSTRNAIMSPDSIQKLSDDEMIFVKEFCDACWSSNPPDADDFYIKSRSKPNALQHEYLGLFIELTMHMPLLVQSMMGPDRCEDMVAAMESMHQIVHGMQLLSAVQKRVQTQMDTPK